jgi:hypothetical protein
MSVMGSIFNQVLDEQTREGCATPAGVGPLTFPQPIDIPAILGRLAVKRGEALNWRSSIVDLLKLLNLDYSLAARRQLAYELGYDDGMEDSAAMNMWLHREVMKKLAESNPKVLSALQN